ncbi:NAD(P)/FAD-dependent oxidoreductase [Kineococcus glutinatus]|uniref:NAD(P)/FAD-dependent oxidoreductase n=1 Tax=Kineococcus glutinatus TaxID=1070872 RepID=UPI0031ECE423
MSDGIVADVLVDVVVVGGGAAGLAGATALSRFRRSVVVVDAGTPRNAPAQGVHNLLGRDGTPPAELLAAGRRELAGYGGRVVDGAVTGVRRVGVPAPEDPAGAGAAAGFAVELADGRELRARRLLVATGLVDELPDVAGLAARWGRDVLHCPYCHGWEVRDRAIAVLATNPVAVHVTQLWRQLSEDVTLVLHSGPEPDAAQREQLAARGVEVVAGPAVEVLVEADRLSGLRLADGRVLACGAVATGTTLRSRADFLAGLGLHPVPWQVGEHVVGTRIEAGPTGATAAAGVFVAGNVTDPVAQVGAAAAAGLTAAAALNADLVEEEVRRAVAARALSPAGPRATRTP